jgi:hypothetical protein
MVFHSLFATRHSRCFAAPISFSPYGGLAKRNPPTSAIALVSKDGELRLAKPPCETASLRALLRFARKSNPNATAAAK